MVEEDSSLRNVAKRSPSIKAHQITDMTLLHKTADLGEDNGQYE